MLLECVAAYEGAVVSSMVDLLLVVGVLQCVLQYVLQ